MPSRFLDWCLNKTTKAGENSSPFILFSFSHACMTRAPVWRAINAKLVLETLQEASHEPISFNLHLFTLDLESIHVFVKSPLLHLQLTLPLTPDGATFCSVYPLSSSLLILQLVSSVSGLHCVPASPHSGALKNKQRRLNARGWGLLYQLCNQGAGLRNNCFVVL